MVKKKIPKIGDSILIEMFHISEMNANFGEPFGESEEDKQLIANVREGKKLVHKILARPENDGYGIIVGRRRFLALKEIGKKSLIVGKDCVIEEMGDEESSESSVVENFLRKDMNPIARAEAFNRVIAFSPGGIRATARRFGLKPQTLSEWLKVLELSPKMQEEVSKGSIYYTDALLLARQKISKEKQDQLAEKLKKEGYNAFLKDVDRITTGKMKRGIPKGIYEVDRILWDKRNRREMSYHKILIEAAKKKGFTSEKGEVNVNEYIKDFIINRIEEIEKEIG